VDIDSVFKNNQKWIQHRLSLNENYFKELSKDQKPDLLYIGCSDSRVSAEEMMGSEPGEVFVHRNIANMIVSIDSNVMSVVNYAVDHLNVNNIVVCGHYGCGGIKAAMQSSDLGVLNPWLRNIRDVYRLHFDVLNDIEDEEEKYKRLVELNVQEQCINLIKTSEVQKAYANRGLKVSGWVFDTRSGKLIDLKIDFSKILKDIMKIYKIT
jgi:carbonic anhydrase